MVRAGWLRLVRQVTIVLMKTVVMTIIDYCIIKNDTDYAKCRTNQMIMTIKAVLY